MASYQDPKQTPEKSAAPGKTAGTSPKPAPAPNKKPAQVFTDWAAI